MTQLLFYSNNCHNSKNVVKSISKSPMRTSVKYICVDNAAVRRKLPPYIKSVPTLVAGSKIIVGNQINDYLQITTLVEKNKAENPKEILPQQPQKPSYDFENGPNAFMTSEMGSTFSDSYSFLGIDTSAQGNGGESMNHNFEFIKGNDKNSNMVNQNMNPVQNNYSEIQNNEKTEELNKKMDEMMSRRELDVPNVAHRL